MMKKSEKFLIIVLFACLFVACNNDDEKKGDPILDVSKIMGKNWYYNAWLGSEDSFDVDDLLEVVRFEQGGRLKQIDFGGRNESIVGSWTSDDEANLINLNYENGERVTWNVLQSNEDYMEVRISDKGNYEFWSELDYLEDLTTDAFLVNEYTEGNQYRTYLGVDVRGNKNIREGKILMTNGDIINLKNHVFYWAEESAKSIVLDGEEREVRFYLRIGSNNIKLKDVIYTSNLPRRTPDQVALEISEFNGEIDVSWTPYTESEVCYKVEILSEDVDLKDPYFVSIVQGGGTSKFTVKTTTAGDVNRIHELESGETYVVRLTALLYEPGIDFRNDKYGYANVQAVAYFLERGFRK